MSILSITKWEEFNILLLLLNWVQILLRYPHTIIEFVCSRFEGNNNIKQHGDEEIWWKWWIMIVRTEPVLSDDIIVLVLLLLFVFRYLPGLHSKCDGLNHSGSEPMLLWCYIGCSGQLLPKHQHCMIITHWQHQSLVSEHDGSPRILSSDTKYNFPKLN